jgi:putative transposase
LSSARTEVTAVLLAVFVSVNGETYCLWRAVDHEGEVLEVFATKRRDRKAALKLLKHTMK